MTDLYFEDLEVNEVRFSEPKLIDEEDMLSFARQYDPQYFHTSSEAAQSHPFGQVAASGIYTLAIWRQLDHSVAGNIRWICGVGWDNVRWSRPMYAGDRVRARWELLEKRQSSKVGRGVVLVDYGLLNQHNEFVFRCHSTNLVEAVSASS